MNGRGLIGLLGALAGLMFFPLYATAGGAVSILSISSPAFVTGQPMPPRCARVHDNISPPLQLANVPVAAKSLALIVDDPDAPGGLFTHWVLWNIAPGTGIIPEGQVPPGARQGVNSFGDTHYDGPAPPNGKHRYFFHLFALDTKLSLPAGSDRDALEDAMKGHIVAKAKMLGTFATGQ